MLRSKRIKTASGARPRAPGTVDGMNDGIVLTLERAVDGAPACAGAVAAAHVFSVTLFPPELPSDPGQRRASAENEAKRSAGNASGSEQTRSSSMRTEEQLPEFVRDSLPRPLHHCQTVATSATPEAHSSPPRRPPPAPGDAAAGPRRRSAEVLQQLSHARNVLLSNLAAPPPAAPLKPAPVPSICRSLLLIFYLLGRFCSFYFFHSHLLNYLYVSFGTCAYLSAGN